MPPPPPPLQLEVKLWQNSSSTGSQAALMRLPKGACSTSACRPIRRRSAQRELITVGTTPSLASLGEGSGNLLGRRRDSR